MLLILMSISLISSLSFMMLKHPMSMGLILLIQTISISLMTSFLNHNSWYSYILFLMMIGGMLILFTYMISVASNEKFKFSIKIMIMTMFLSMILIPWNFMDNYFLYMNTLNMENLLMNINFSNSMMKFLNFPNNMILFMMIIYLLITLIAAVKLTKHSSGPLRQMN
uniref:NADH dehydrogenase subunit 6 n=1 Tax=Apogonia cf. basalis TaxID=2962665 RepID=UPI0021150A53|nr:NADH dehydrogenase subunit 6 [Apogonia cf. basalis]UTE83848.1 NADH dehydrogenase subunit 6 [Apogonia cf. basalis]